MSGQRRTNTYTLSGVSLDVDFVYWDGYDATENEPGQDAVVDIEAVRVADPTADIAELIHADFMDILSRRIASIEIDTEFGRSDAGRDEA